MSSWWLASTAEQQLLKSLRKLPAQQQPTAMQHGHSIGVAWL
jgi:hypothetical protein